MNFLRLCFVAIAFLALPLALITYADVWVVEKELPTLLSETARAAVTSPETRPDFADGFGEFWIEENPEIAAQLTAEGLDPQAVMSEAFDRLSRTPAFATEIDRAATAYGESFVDGTASEITFNFDEAIRQSGVNFDPAVMDSLQAYSTFETTPIEDEDVLRSSDFLRQTKQLSGFTALGALLLLLLLTRSARPHLSSLFFIGMPVLLLQRLLLNEIADDPDPMDALIGGAIRDTWMPWTHLMMAVSGASLFVLIVSYKLFPKDSFNTVPYAKETGFVPERPVKTAEQGAAGYQTPRSPDSFDWSGDNDHRGLRELSIVED